MSAQLQEPISPDARAECGRCGSLVRWARKGRHERHHEWEDELARQLQVLQDAGQDAPLLSFGDDLEPDPFPAPEPGQAPTEPVAVPPHEPADEPAPEPADDADLRHFSRF